MLPPQECLCASESVSRQPEDGLVDEAELIAMQRLTELADEVESTHSCEVHRGRVMLEAALFTMLGGVHRQISIANEVFCRISVVCNGDPHARRQLDVGFT